MRAGAGGGRRSPPKRHVLDAGGSSTVKGISVVALPAPTVMEVAAMVVQDQEQQLLASISGGVDGGMDAAPVKVMMDVESAALSAGGEMSMAALEVHGYGSMETVSRMHGIRCNAQLNAAASPGGIELCEGLMPSPSSDCGAERALDGSAAPCTPGVSCNAQVKLAAGSGSSNPGAGMEATPTSRCDAGRTVEGAVFKFGAVHKTCPPTVQRTDTSRPQQAASNGWVTKQASTWQKPTMIPFPAKLSTGDFVIGENTVVLDEEAIQTTAKQFKCALMGRLFGKKLPFHHLNTELHRQWERFGLLKVITVCADCFVCFFPSIVTREEVLLDGPWIITGQVLGVDRWSLNFSPLLLRATLLQFR